MSSCPCKLPTPNRNLIIMHRRNDVYESMDLNLYRQIIFSIKALKHEVTSRNKDISWSKISSFVNISACTHGRKNFLFLLQRTFERAKVSDCLQELNCWEVCGWYEPCYHIDKLSKQWIIMWTPFCIYQGLSSVLPLKRRANCISLVTTEAQISISEYQKYAHRKSSYNFWITQSGKEEAYWWWLSSHGLHTDWYPRRGGQYGLLWPAASKQVLINQVLQFTMTLVNQLQYKAQFIHSCNAIFTDLIS